MKVGVTVRLKDSTRARSGQVGVIVASWALGGVEVRWPGNGSQIFADTGELEEVRVEFVENDSTSDAT